MQEDIDDNDAERYLTARDLPTALSGAPNYQSDPNYHYFAFTPYVVPFGTSTGIASTPINAFQNTPLHCSHYRDIPYSVPAAPVTHAQVHTEEHLEGGEVDGLAHVQCPLLLLKPDSEGSGILLACERGQAGQEVVRYTSDVRQLFGISVEFEISHAASQWRVLSTNKNKIFIRCYHLPCSIFLNSKAWGFLIIFSGPRISVVEAG